MSHIGLAGDENALAVAATQINHESLTSEEDKANIGWKTHNKDLTVGIKVQMMVTNCNQHPTDQNKQQTLNGHVYGGEKHENIMAEKIYSAINGSKKMECQISGSDQVTVCESEKGLHLEDEKLSNSLDLKESESRADVIQLSESLKSTRIRRHRNSSMEGENSNESASSSQSQPSSCTSRLTTPSNDMSNTSINNNNNNNNNNMNCTAMNVVESFISSATTCCESQSTNVNVIVNASESGSQSINEHLENESHHDIQHNHIHSVSESSPQSSSSQVNSGVISKKCFGKFKFLLDNDSEREANTDINNCVANGNHCESNNDLNSLICEDNSIDSIKYDIKVNSTHKQEKEETLYGCFKSESSTPKDETNDDDNIYDKQDCTGKSINEDNDDDSNSSPFKSKSTLKPRRGRPAGSTKNKEKDKMVYLAQLNLDLEESNRRRSDRLKTLEERKEMERELDSKCVSENEHDEGNGLSDSNNESKNNANKPQTHETNSKQKKKKLKKKEKEKERERKKKDKAEKEKKNKRKTRQSEKIEREEKSDKNKNWQSNHKTSSSQHSEFIAPLPPSNMKYNAISNKHSNSNNSSESEDSPRPEKVKSRWRRNSELESGHGFNHSQTFSIPKETEPLPPFDMIDESLVLFERSKSKSKNDIKRMQCDCILTKEERQRGILGCGDDCLNRMLMIECGSRCSLGDHCANKRFQKKQHSKVEPFKTKNKGWGLRAMQHLPSGTFVMEYVGEVLDPFEFHKRVEQYDNEKVHHHYFMALKSDEIIDATKKGNVTRFVNHSCDPNCETQKWTVNGELRIGFFTIRYVYPGEEITFDYQFQRYGREAQKCYCDSANCRGYIGATDTAEIFTDGSRITPKQKLKNAEIEALKEEELLEDLALEDEIAKLAASGGLKNRQQVLTMARLMVRAEDSLSRQKLIDIIKGTKDDAYLRLLLDYHGLQLIWSWMVDVNDILLKGQILEVLEILPVPNKTMLQDSKVLAMVERWSQQVTEDTINSSPPLTTNVESNASPVKLNQEMKGDETKMDVQEVKESAEIDMNKEVLDLENKDVKLEDEEMTTCKDEESIVDTSVNKNEVKEDSQINVENDVSVNMVNSDKEVDPTQTAAETTTSTPTEASKPTTPIVRTELKGSIVVKVVQKTSDKSCPATALPIEPLVKPPPNISSMANKLLNLWKDLKEVFRIPRLERKKRHEDELEADRRTQEVEERRAKGLPIMNEKSDRDYTIAGILGIRRKGLKRSVDGKESFRKALAMGCNINSSSFAASKMSKEEHRLKFEQEVAQRDYEEKMKRYHQELADYNAMYGAYIQNQNYPNPYDSTTLEQSSIDYSSYNQYNTDTTSGYEMSNQDYYTIGQILDSNDLTYSTEQYDDTSYQDEYLNEDNDLYLKNLFSYEQKPCLIPLANFDDENDATSQNDMMEQKSAMEVDNQDFKIYENYLPHCNQDSSLIFDSTYPPSGIFYITPEPDVKHIFVPYPVDTRNTPIQLNSFHYNLHIPHDYIQNDSIHEMPSGWKHALDKQGRIYYYNRVTRKSQWSFPIEPIIAEVENKLTATSTPISDDVNAIKTESSLDSLVKQVETETVEEKVEDVLMNEDCSEDATENNVVNQEEEETQESAVNSEQSTPSTTNEDPRKRSIMTADSVMSTMMTTQAAADTSSSASHRKRAASTRKVQETFRAEMSKYVVHCLNPFRKSDCKLGRISCTDDFKFLARKLTHSIMDKEIKHCRSLENLSCNEAVKQKTKEYIRKYMVRYGSCYRPDNVDNIANDDVNA